MICRIVNVLLWLTTAWSFCCRTASDKGRPYEFTDAATLLKDFHDEVERVLGERGFNLDVIGEATIDQER